MRCITVYEIKFSWMNDTHNSLLQVLPKAGWMGLRETHIFVQVKKCGLSPINVGLMNKRLEKFKLRSSRSCNHVSVAMFGNGITDDLRSIRRCCLAHLLF